MNATQAAASSHAAPGAQRQAMLVQLTGTLEALVGKLAAQREVAVGACALAPRAEEIARQARLLAFGRGRVPPQALADFVAAITEMAADAAAVAAEIERSATLGAEVARSLGGHVAALAAIAADPARLSDPAALRPVLTALAGTIQRAATQRDSDAAASGAVLGLGGRAAGFAARARDIAAGGSGMQDEMLALSRELGSYAAQAASVAGALSTDAAAGEKVIADMVGRIRGIAAPPAPVKGPVDERIASILRDGARPPGGGAIDWGVTGPPR